MIRTSFAVAFVLGLGEEAFACSGPAAGRHMMISFLIGLTCAALSVVVVLGGRVVLRRRSLTRRASWLTALLVFQPMSCVGVSSGDCGYMLRLFALVALGFIIAVVGLTLAWPRDESPAGPGHRAALGAIVGASISLPTAVLAFVVSVTDSSHVGT